MEPFLKAISFVNGPLTLVAFIAVIVLAIFYRSVNDKQGLKYVYELTKNRLTKDQFYNIAKLIIVLLFLAFVIVILVSVVTWVRVSTSPPTQVSESLISNLSVTTLREYMIVEAGLKAGTPAFVDNRNYIFTKVPSFLEGATYIKTANDDKCIDDPPYFALRFDINRPVTVYVAHDDRYQTKPTWISDFKATAESVNLNLPGASNGRFTLYTKDYQAGTVVLGSNIDGDCRVEGNYGMYSVIIVSK